MEDDLKIESFVKTEPKKGRRATAKILSSESNDLLSENIDNVKIKEEVVASKPSRRQMGWDRKSSNSSNEPIDVRLIPSINDDNDSTEKNSIPDLAEIHEDPIIQEVAAPPTLFIANIASYKELDTDLVNCSAFRTLDGDIDLKALVKNLSSEQEAQEEVDAPWQWESLFADISERLMPE